VVVPVPSKAEVIPTVKKIINMLETQSGQKLRKVRTDRGGEYLNNELKDFYSAKGTFIKQLHLTHRSKMARRRGSTAP
jgi:hypothetical protein